MAVDRSASDAAKRQESGLSQELLDTRMRHTGSSGHCPVALSIGNK